MRALLAVTLLLAAAAPARADTETVSPRGGAFQVASDANARGDAVVAFRGRSGALQVAFAARGGRFGRARRVPGGRIGGYEEGTRVAIDERGDALIVWTSSDGSRPEDPEARDAGCCVRVRALIRRRSGRLTRVRTVNRRGDDASLIDIDAAGGRFGALWYDYGAASGRLAVGGRRGRFGLRRKLPGRAERIGLALSARRILVHELRERAARPIRTVRYSGRRPGRRPRRRQIRGTGGIGYLSRFTSNARGDILGLYRTYSPLRDRIVTGGRRSRARRVRGRYERIALASSGRGVVARDRGAAIVVRLRRANGTLTPPRRRSVPRLTGLAAAAVNRAGRHAVAYRAGRRSLGVLAGGRRRTVTRRGGLARNPLHVDDRGRIRVIYVSRGRVRAWRSGG